MWPWHVKMATQNLLKLLLLLILTMRNVLTTVVCRFGSWSLVMKLNFVQTLSTRFGQEFEVEVQAKFWNWSLVSILLLRLGEVMKWLFGRDFEVKVWSKCWCLVEILKLMQGRDSEDVRSRFVFELVIWPKEVILVSRTQPSGPLCLWHCLSFSLNPIFNKHCSFIQFYLLLQSTIYSILISDYVWIQLAGV